MEHNNNNNNNDQNKISKGKTKLCDLNLGQMIEYLNSIPSNHKFDSNDYDEWLICIKKYLNSFPPGYQFNPSDKEIIVDYLLPKINGRKLPLNLMHEVNIYKFNPDELAAMYSPQGSIKEGCWYFFTSRDKKYKNGKRPNRRAGDGYWKATGADKCIRHNNIEVGFRKALVYYKGNPPRGLKTFWIMHEFREAGPSQVQDRKFSSIPSEDTSMRLDDYVLCRIYQKIPPANKNKGLQPQEEDESFGDELEQEIFKNVETSPTDNMISPPIYDNNVTSSVLVFNNNTTTTNNNNVANHVKRYVTSDTDNANNTVKMYETCNNHQLNMYYPSNNGFDNTNTYHGNNNWPDNNIYVYNNGRDNHPMIGESSTIDNFLNNQSTKYDDYSASYDVGLLESENFQLEGDNNFLDGSYAIDYSDEMDQFLYGTSSPSLVSLMGTTPLGDVDNKPDSLQKL